MDGGAFAFLALDLKAASDYLQALLHADHAEALAPSTLLHWTLRGAFAVVLNGHAYRVLAPLDVYFHGAGLGVSVHIGKRFLDDSIKDDTYGYVQLFHFGKDRDTNAEARLLGVCFDQLMQGRNQAKVVEKRGTEIAREPMHDVHRLFHQLLCVRELPAKAPALNSGFCFQSGQPKIHTHESLGDFIMQLPADAQALFLLRVQELMGEPL